MGNICATREDSPRETRRQYEDYTNLWHEIIAKLSDDVAFTNECARVYRDECMRRGLQQLTKQQWQEMTTSFVKRIACDDQRTKEKIYRAVDGLYLGPGDRQISEATFAEFTRLALTLAERDLRERIAKIQDKFQGQPPIQPQLPPAAAPYGSYASTTAPAVSTPSAIPPGVQTSWSSDRSVQSSYPVSSRQPAWQPPQQLPPQQPPLPPYAQQQQLQPPGQQLPPGQQFHQQQQQQLQQLQQQQQQQQHLHQQPMYPPQQLQQQWAPDDGIPPRSPPQQRPSEMSPPQQWPSISEASPPPQQQRAASPMPSYQHEKESPPLKLPLSAQRLQDLQRKQAEQEQRLHSLQQQQQQQQQGQQQSWQMEHRSQPAPEYLERQVPGPGMSTPRGPGDIPMDDSPSHVSCVLPRDRVVNGDTAGGPTTDAQYSARNGVPLKPPALGGGAGGTQPVPPEMPVKPCGVGATTAQALDRQQLDDMKREILFGNLKIYVFNKHLELQAKKLALNPHSRRISILQENGLCEDSWEIDSLRCITQGIDSSILAEAPPPGAASFRFKFQDSDTEDRFLCVVFETHEHCLLATEAFGQLCEVPVTAV